MTVEGFTITMYHVTVYTISWVVLLSLIVVERRSIWFRELLSPLRYYLHRYGFVFGVVDKHFQVPELLHLPFLVLMVASNLLVLLLSIHTDQVHPKLAELILMNITVLFLLLNRHSPFLELAAIQQPGYLWFHRIAGSIIMAEVVAFSVLSSRGSHCLLKLEYAN